MAHDHVRGTSRHATFRRWLDAWYAPYALLGTTTAGIAFVLLPLGVARSGNAGHVGLLMAVNSAGTLTAAAWGGLADRLRWHRLLFAGGMATAALAFAGFALTDDLSAWFLLALLLGIGSAATGTVANLFVSEAHPRPEWDERFGWMQTVYNAGIACGLLLAAVLVHVSLRAGFFVAALITAAGTVGGLLTTRIPPRAGAAPSLPARPRHRADRILSAPGYLVSTLRRATFRRAATAVRSPFGIFLLVWSIANLGTAGIYALYPVLMRDEFGVSPGISSVALSAATAASIPLYSPAGLLAARIGAARVLQVGLAARLAGLAALVALGSISVTGRGGLAVGAFLLLALVWPLLSVGSTALVAALSPVGEGEGNGLYNTCFALAELAGTALGGAVVGWWGYNAASVLALAGVIIGLALASPLRSADGA